MINIIDSVSELFSPHIRKGCNKPGATLCDNCIFDNIDNKYAKCLICEALCKGDNLCQRCHNKMPFDRAFVVGERKGVLKK